MHTRGSRRRVRALTDRCQVVKTTSSPSRSNQTGTTWGRPSLRTVAIFAVWGRSSRNRFQAASAILAISVEGYKRFSYPSEVRRGGPFFRKLITEGWRRSSDRLLSRRHTLKRGQRQTIGL